MGEVEGDRELARLRARAYGPDGDIGADPVALARLVELESAAAARSASAGIGPSVAEATGEAIVEAAEQLLADAASTPGPPARRRRRSVLRALVMAVTSVGVAGAGAAVAVVVVSAGAAHDATLAPAERPVVAAQAAKIDVTDVVTYGEFRGMQVGSGVRDGAPCLVVLRTVETGVGPPVLGCGAPGLAATVDVTILAQSAGGARSTSGSLAPGTVVRFTRGNDVVYVDVSDGPATVRPRSGADR